MFIGNCSGFQPDGVWKYANKGCAAAGAALIFAFCALSFFTLKQKDPVGQSMSSSFLSLEKRYLPTEDYEAIGTGALALSSYRFSEFIPRLSREVVLLARNTRPDAYKSEASVLLGLKSAKEERVVKSGETFYLKDNEKGWRSLLTFSPKSTGLVLKPLFTEKGAVSFEVAKEGEHEKRQFSLSSVLTTGQATSPLLKKQETPYMQSLKQAKCWGKDILLQEYGGEEYRRMRDKQKVQLESGGGSYVSYVAQGDYLTWQEEKWKVVPFEEVKPDAPVAYVQSATPKGVEIVAWDETGFFRSQLKAEAQAAPKLAFKPEQFLTSVRLRNNSQVTCVAGKRRLILNQGDWLLKTASGWRHLKKWQQIEECLQHRLRGELFIVDSIDKTQGKAMLQGNYFDEMRTQIVPVSIPITSEQKPARSHTKRKREL